MNSMTTRIQRVYAIVIDLDGEPSKPGTIHPTLKRTTSGRLFMPPAIPLPLMSQSYLPVTPRLLCDDCIPHLEIGDPVLDINCLSPLDQICALGVPATISPPEVQSERVVISDVKSDRGKLETSRVIRKKESESYSRPHAAVGDFANVGEEIFGTSTEAQNVG